MFQIVALSMTDAMFAGNLALHRRGFRIQRVHAACDLPLPFIFRQRVFQHIDMQVAVAGMTEAADADVFLN